MRPVIVFAGTTEGRMLSEYLSGQQVPVTACVATEYGETLLPENAWLRVHAGRMNQEQIKDYIREQKAELVVDATHPYAAEASENVYKACADASAEYIRLIREPGQTEASDAVHVSSVDEAVEYLRQTSGNILATTGSKELKKYTMIPDYGKRVFARVLSTGEVAKVCERLGFCGRNLICMQGPFSEELNTAMLRQFDCRYLVTKETGRAGGFEEKIRAAKKAGAKVILVGRPKEQKGYSYHEVLRILNRRLGLEEKERACSERQEKEVSEADSVPQIAPGDVKKRTVTLVGIGMGNPSGMTIEAAEAIEEADLLVGAKRMLEAAGDTKKPFYTDYDAYRIADYIAAHPEYVQVAVLLSGDIGFYSGAKRLYDALDGQGCEIRSLCGISSVVYFCGRLRLTWEDVCLKSAHGRYDNLVHAVKTSRKTFTLLSAAGSVADLCRELQEYGLSRVQVHIGERLGYAEEKITSGTPAELETGSYDGLCVALIENREAFSSARACIDDGEFLRGKAPMTKSEIRSLSVAKLQLAGNSVVYDVGAGTGSVSIEAALQAPEGIVYAVERNGEACRLIEENKRRFGTPNIKVIHGLAPEALEELPTPTHAFIGGSAGNLYTIIQRLLDKNPHIRLVINAVTVETAGEAVQCLKSLPLIEEEMISVSVAKAKKLGNYHLMAGQNPVYIVTCRGGEA